MTTITDALAAVMHDVTHVPKGDFNQQQGFRFRGIDATVKAVGPALRTHRVAVIPNVRSVEWATVRTARDKPATACRVVVEYRFVGPAGDEIVSSVAGEAWDMGDKATPKAMSVAFRTALLQALCLPTDEPDPDQDTYQQAEPAEAPAAEAPPAEPTADELRTQIRNMAKALDIPQAEIVADFQARAQQDIRTAEPKYLAHYLGHLRTHGFTRPEGAHT